MSINLSAWGLMVRWRLSGPCSCQMGLPEPVGEGGGRRSPCCRAWRLPYHPWAFTAPASPPPPSPPRGPPSLPHQDTEHCMNSGLNGIISEFWSTASSGCFTNYLSLLCGGQSTGWGQVTDSRGPVHCLGEAVPHPWRHLGLCRQMVCVSLAPLPPTWQELGSGWGSEETACG